MFIKKEKQGKIVKKRLKMKRKFSGEEGSLEDDSFDSEDEDIDAFELGEE